MKTLGFSSLWNKILRLGYQTVNTTQKSAFLWVTWTKIKHATSLKMIKWTNEQPYLKQEKYLVLVRVKVQLELKCANFPLTCAFSWVTRSYHNSALGLNFSVQMELNPWKPRDFLVYEIRYSDWVSKQ